MNKSVFATDSVYKHILICYVGRELSLMNADCWFVPSLLDRALCWSHPVLSSQHHLQKEVFWDVVIKATSKFTLWPAISPISFLCSMKVAVAGCLGFLRV